MHRASVFLAALVLHAAVSARADAQDLFERARKERERSRGSADARAYTGRDRLDLRVSGSLPPLVPDRGSARLGLDASIETDFACGRFDLKANLKSLVGKEARDEYLDALIGALESELLNNALVLL